MGLIEDLDLNSKPQAQPFEFRSISPQDLHLYWDWIRKGLEKIKLKTKIRLTWTEDHIRASLLQNQALLYVGLRDGCLLNFSILSVTQDPFLQVPTALHVWAFYAERNFDEATDLSMGEIIKLGKRLCLSSITVQGRRGWIKRMRQHGSINQSTLFEMRI